MKGRGLIALFALLVLILAVVLAKGLLVQEENGYSHLKQVRFLSNPLSAEEVENKIEKGKQQGANRAYYTAWTQRRDQTVENDETGKTWKGDVLIYWGDNSGIFDLHLKNGCALPRSAAYDLWGTEEVKGGTKIRINGRNYVVEKMAEGEQLIVKDTGTNEKKGNGTGEESTAGEASITGDASEKMNQGIFDVLNVDTSKLKGRLAAEESAYLKSHYEGQLFIDYDFLLQMLRKIQVLPVWTGVCFLAFLLFKRAFHIKKQKGTYSKKERFQKGGYWLGALALLGFCGFCYGSPIPFPQSLIPTQWSDFSFWGEAIFHVKQEISDYFSMTFYGPDREFFTGVLQISLCSGLSVVSVGYLISYLKRTYGLRLKKTLLCQFSEREGGIGRGINSFKRYCKEIRK